MSIAPPRVVRSVRLQADLESPAKAGHYVRSANARILLAGATLAAVWLGPLPAMAMHSFAAHMTMHMAVVAVVAPLVALTVAGARFDPVRLAPRVLAPIPLSVVELVVVWGWHAPLLHEAARQHSIVLVLEQGSFFVAGALLWVAAIGGDREQRRMRAGSGVAALLLTSMHMTLLGALFALAGRPLFLHAGSAGVSSAVADQQLGGVIMLLVGGSAYLAGGLWLTAIALRPGLLAIPAAGERSA